MLKDVVTMTNLSIKSLCRICLEDGATCPIFEDIEQNNIRFKLKECFLEKIEDIEGFPRNICFTCNKTLNSVYNFINKFRETHKLLKGGLISLKQENKCAYTDFDIGHQSEVEIEIKGIKSEPETSFEIECIEDTEQLIELFQPLQDVTKKEINKGSFKTGKKKKSHKNKYKNRTDKVATSILEGEFAWTGETWCLKSTQIKIAKEKGKSQRRDTRLKLPKKTIIKQPKLCDICGDTFKTQYKLNTHRKKIHFSNPTKCTQCSRICSSENNLLRHMKRKHADKEFICATCGSGFAFRGELRNHINKVHSKRPKPKFACKYCEKTYITQKSVVIHERSAHTGERPAECTICFKGFFHEEYLKEHMRLHTGEAPFKCPVCNRGYAQRGNMKSHLRIHRISEIDAITLSKMKPNYIKLLKK